MKKIIVLALLIWSVNIAYSQIDSLFIKDYEQKIHEISKLKNDLQVEKNRFSSLSAVYKKDTLKLQTQIKKMEKELSSSNLKVSALNKNKIKEERDNLQRKVDSLNALISKQNQTIKDKDDQISNEKIIAKTTADNARNDGKVEVLARIVNSYKNRSFDDLIEFSSKESVARDRQLVATNPEVIPILNDLHIYFKSFELLLEKFDAVKIKNAQTQLRQIKRQSNLLEVLKDNIDSYNDLNAALRETISQLVELDKSKSTAGDAAIQKLKYNDIVTILTDYIYNYYSYVKNPYLSDIVNETINRKHFDADADMTDLLNKLQ